MKNIQSRPPVERKVNSFLVSISAVILGIIAGCILLLCIGKNPMLAITKIGFGALSSTRRIGNMIAISTQLMLVGLSVGFAYKTGLFNIGGSGQILMGGITASIMAYYLTGLPRPVYLVLVILASMLAGAIWGSISGFLKAKFNVHEVVSSIMLNWTAYWIVYELIPRLIVDPMIAVKSKAVLPEMSLRTPWLSHLFGNSYINYGIILAIAATLIIKFILDKTTLGFGLKAVGANRFCAEYAGINVNRNIVISMAIAGALSGLAGLTLYCGYSNIMQKGVMPSEGFDGIAVALLGNSNPYGIFFSALFFGILKSGKGSLGAGAGIPSEIADTIIATIIYFTATSMLFHKFWNGLFHKSYEKKMALYEKQGGSTIKKEE